MRVFVTGASGFIGRALAERWRAAGAEVGGVDLHADPSAGVVAGDVGTPGEWQDAAAGADIVVHTAAIVSLRLERPDEVWRINVAGTRNALDAAVRAGASRFVHFSSVTVFGFEFPDGVTEDHPVRLTGIPYPDTKIASEQVVLQAHAAGEIPVTVIRPGDVYGPKSRVWAVLPVELIRARRYVLPMGGRGIFSPVYVDNLVDGVVAAAGERQAAGRVLTLTDGTGVPNREFFGHYAEALAQRLLTVPTPIARLGAAVVQLAEKPRAGDNDVNPAAVRYMTRPGTYSNARARELLGWEPRVGLEDGMARTLAWLRDEGLI